MNVRELIEQLEAIEVNQEAEVVVRDEWLVTGVDLVGERVIIETNYCYEGRQK